MAVSGECLCLPAFQSHLRADRPADSLSSSPRRELTLKSCPLPSTSASQRREPVCEDTHMNKLKN